MSTSLRRLLIALALLVLFYAGASVLATLSQLANAADRVAMGAGQYVFWSLLALFAGLAATPLLLYFRLPKPLIPPASQQEPAYGLYLQRVLASLQRNPLLQGQVLRDAHDIAPALEHLGKLADEAALKAASGTFVSTALMQNGRLDGLIVLALQLRLVWRLMCIYQLRPSPRQALYIYANVGGALLVASSIEDVDFAEITTPLLSAAAPSLAENMPGLGGLSRLLGNSLANGAANAFLTLRVAMLTKQYCQALVRPDPVPLRKSASLAALALLAVVSRDSGARVVKAVFKGAGGALSGAASATTQNVMNSVSSGANAAGGQVRKVGQQLGRAFSASAEGARKMVGLGPKPQDKDAGAASEDGKP
ncbi:hypothetical protein DBR47_23800 [Paucibacter sp. KBW04]|uniref:DUF697 domain-containing protein n=1 Tax=Paucibacter sp. KBW04 TaxID=2153361 RepID=UPI000F579944|nr:DUF697 domain-containing protein [Paucibacter sp. KBW04]RQO53451.1 hypothetical protein DBR47_23800 [Paucibacter sp. KBW04]